MNNYEKDCVIAFCENKYLKVFSIKTSGRYKAFV